MGPILLVHGDEEACVDLGRELVRCVDLETIYSMTERGAISATVDNDPFLALIDVDCPGVDATRLAATLRRLRPDMRIVLCSPAEDAEDHLKMTSADGVLVTPFSIGDLIPLIHAALPVEASALQ